MIDFLRKLIGCEPREPENYSAEWDRILTDLLDTFEVEEVGMHTVTLGGVEVWIGNRPYADGTQHRVPYGTPVPRVSSNARPSNATLERLRAVVDRTSNEARRKEMRDFRRWLDAQAAPEA